MKIYYITVDLLCPPLVLKLKQEGHDVVLYEKEKGDTLKGTIKRGEWSKRQDPCDLYIYEDVGMGNEPSDERKTNSVIGGSVMSDAMELNRIKGGKVAKLAGIKVPETIQFKSIKEIKDYIKENPKRFVMKQEGDLDGIKGLNFVAKTDDSSDLVDYLEWLEPKWVEGLKQDFVLQEFVKGYEFACGAYWNGTEFSKDKDGDEVCEENFEHKSLMAGDMGVSTGEMFTLMRYRKAKNSKIFKETLDKCRELLKKIDFRGNVDANCIITQDGAYLLEWTMRFGSPATSGQLAIHKTGWGEFLKAVADGKQIPFEYDPRWTIIAFLYVPPFPHSLAPKIAKMTEDKYAKNPPKTSDDRKDLLEHRLTTSKDLIVKLPKDLKDIHLEFVYYKDGQVKLANDGGYVLTVSGQGETPKEAGENATKVLKEIVVPKGFWRNDFTGHWDKAHEDLEKWGYLEKPKDETDEVLKEIKQVYDSKVKKKDDEVSKIRKIIKKILDDN